MDTPQALFVIGNLVVLRSEKLPFVFLHGIFLSIFMGRRTLAFNVVPPPVGDFGLGGGITTLSDRKLQTFFADGLTFVGLLFIIVLVF